MKNNSKFNAIFIMGPTAAGKTDFAIELSFHLPIEIISVDSAMVYRGMDIGTGKPDPLTLRKTPHYLIDIRKPNEPYSAAEFSKDALNLMHEITSRGNIPCLVGGTMLYFRALQQGLSPLPSADFLIREKLLNEAKLIGWDKMHDRLKQIDPIIAKRLHPNDMQRIQRALEVYEITGKPMSSYFAQDSKNTEGYLVKNGIPTIENYHIHSFALAPTDRAVLHQRIAARFHEMLKRGLIEEVENLYKQYNLSSDMPSMRSVGYRQVAAYLMGEYEYDHMVDKAIASTRQLAKRQLTWLNNSFDCQWLENNHLASLKSVIHCVS